MCIDIVGVVYTIQYTNIVGVVDTTLHYIDIVGVVDTTLHYMNIVGVVTTTTDNIVKMWFTHVCIIN